MVSRETIVHLVAVGLAVAVLGVASYFEVDTASGPAAAALLLVFYGLVLGGAHLYLAVRGEDGMVPVEARWRYVAMIAGLLAVAAVVMYGGDRTVGPIALETVGAVVALGIVVLYFVAESVSGYRESRSV